MAPTACFVSASRQNVFFAELLDALADELANQGVTIERAVDHFPAPRREMAYVFVPHELMPLLMQDALPSEQQLQRSVAICTEQPGTHWFAESAEVASRAARAIDINRVGVSALSKLGVDARFLQLGYTARWDRWNGDEQAERSIDVAMLAGATPRRLTAVASCAGQLAGRPTELHLPEALVPHSADSEVFISGGRKWDLLARSRLLLNVHRGELGYFEWQRAVEAIANGCVLLSEHSLGFAPLAAGEHFISVSYDSLDVALEGLLDDRPRLARIRSAAYRILRDEYPLSASIAVLAEAIDEAARRPLAGSAASARPGQARPKPAQLPPPAWELAADANPQGARAAVHEPMGGRPQSDRAAGSRPVEHRLPAPDRTERIGAANESPPRLSVVLTVADQATSVAATIESVSLSDYRSFELVVVDDASGDGSGERIRAALDHAPWIASTLITRARRGGLARARNAGTEVAAGELVLFLGAGDEPFAHALRRLVQALDETPTAAFAYGIVAQIGADGPSGLSGYLGWDPAMLRYGNFIDSMAMIRRSAIDAIGGFATEQTLSGWEDLALWCAFAERDWGAVRVPEIVATQQLGRGRASDPDPGTSAAWSLLLDRFGWLSASAAA